MTKPLVRLLPFTVADGPHNMAADEVMLESAIAGQVTIRLYSWDPPTLSLGYFQRHQERLHDPQLANMPWVRRPTGGGAIVHAGDLTYAIALPRNWHKGLSPAEWHCQLHHALAGLLREHGIAAEVVAGQRLPPSHFDFLCFAVPQPGDVVWHEQAKGAERAETVSLPARKIIGGAQRLRAGALLQHGSIQLPSSLSQTEELGQRLASMLGWKAMVGDWTAAELARIEELAASKYSQAWWNKKR